MIYVLKKKKKNLKLIISLLALFSPKRKTIFFFLLLSHQKHSAYHDSTYKYIYTHELISKLFPSFLFFASPHMGYNLFPSYITASHGLIKEF